MIVITFNTGDNFFTINSRKFTRNYQAIAQGNDNISIHSIYDTRYQILGSTKYDEVEINGITYTNQDDLLSVLIDILKQPIGTYSRDEIDSKDLNYYNDIKETVESISAGEGGIIYDSLADAQALNPKPSNGTIFQVSEIIDPDNSGVYSFQSAETNGTRFEREYLIEESLAKPLEGLDFTEIKSSNLINYNDVEIGVIVSQINENTESASNYQTFDFIPVTEGESYVGIIKDSTTSSIFRHVAFYDINKVFISGIDGFLTSFAVPTGVSFVRLDTFNEAFSTTYKPENIGLFISSTTAFEPYYTPKVKLILKDGSGDLPNSIATKSDLISSDEIEVLDLFIKTTEISTNLYNPNTEDIGFYVNDGNGKLVAFTNYKTSDFIAVDPNTIYSGLILNSTTQSIFRKVAFYDTNKVFISGIDGFLASFTTPTNTAFVKVSPDVENTTGLFLGQNPVWEEYYNKEVISLRDGSGSGDNAIITRKDLSTEVLPTVENNFEVRIDESGNSYVKTVINEKELIQNIRPFSTGEIFDFTDVVYDGVFVKRGGDEAAPYRIDGSTLGANHNTPGNLNRSIEFFIDDEKISNLSNTYYPKTSLTVREYYDIVGVNTTGIIAKVSMSYVFDKFGGCTIYTDFLAEQAVPLNNIMFTQAVCMQGDVSYYIPKTLPKTQDGITYDFSQPYNMSGFAPVSNFQFTLNDCEPTGLLPDRLIMLRNDIGFVHGYLPVQSTGVSERRVNVDNSAWEVRNNTKKSYPNAIDGASGEILNVGDYYSTIAYRRYFVPQATTTASYFIPSNVGTYVYLDWHTSTKERIELPAELSGKPYEVVEKSDSVIIHSKENTGKMLFEVNTKGYVILKFN